MITAMVPAHGSFPVRRSAAACNWDRRCIRQALAPQQQLGEEKGNTMDVPVSAADLGNMYPWEGSN